MLIHRIAAQLYTAEAPRVIEEALLEGKDATLAVSQSGRVLMLAAQFARTPRPCVYVVSGEDAADRAARQLAAYVGAERVARYPERADYPWSTKASPDDAVIARRCHALGRLARGEACIMVASARALLRCVPPRGASCFPTALRLLSLPADEEPVVLVPIGYPADEPAEKQRKPLSAIFSRMD